MKLSILERWAKDAKELPVHQETITFTINGKEKSFDLIHNFNFLHLDIYKAFDEWGKQTRNHTAMDFCRFVMGHRLKEAELICIPKEEWEEFQLNQEKFM